MSRGFVKEDDQEEAPVIPPRASLPDSVINYVTPEGLTQLKLELKSLEDNQRTLTVEDERERRREVSVITAKMNLLKERLASARVINPSEQPQDEIRFGAIVKLKNLSHNTIQEFQIVGVDEADVRRQKIAFTAPIAKVIIGYKIGDEVIFNLGNEARTLKILAISYPQASASGLASA